VIKFAAWLLTLMALIACSKRQAPPVADMSSPRLVSLSPSATETVAAVGAAQFLVGVDEYSTFPPSVIALPKIGKYLTPNLETILRMKPTLVLVDDIHRATAEALHDAGIETLRCEIQNLADVEAAIQHVGDKLDRKVQAADAIAKISTARAAAIRNRKNIGSLSVLAIIDRAPGGLDGLVAAGPGSWIDELLTVVGATNALVASPVRYPKISVEEVLRADPDFVLDLSDAATHEDAQAIWRMVSVKATKSNRIRVLADSFLRAPSPRVDSAVQALQSALR
jgi:iron complex transport system substrate-binding protein